MSNRVRRQPLSTQARHAIQRAARCPDCASLIRLHGALLDIAHDPECPAYAQLRRRGRALEVVYVHDVLTDAIYADLHTN